MLTFLCFRHFCFKNLEFISFYLPIPNAAPLNFIRKSALFTKNMLFYATSKILGSWLRFLNYFFICDFFLEIQIIKKYPKFTLFRELTCYYFNYLNFVFVVKKLNLGFQDFTDECKPVKS